MKQQVYKIITVIVCFLLTTALSSWNKPAKKQSPEFYQLTVYHYNNIQQQQVLDNYLQNALMPALHRQNINTVGVFRALANDTAVLKTMYVLFPVKNIEAINKIQDKLATDNEYQISGSAYINAGYTTPSYDRMETILLKAFHLAPTLQVPQLKAAKKDRVYELRSYESASEKIFKNKVHMFNEGDEIGLFKKLNFNAVFYSEVIAGGKMPNLMYMTSFENMDDRNLHWKTFGDHPDWKKLSSLPEYQHNVSHIDITFLKPVDYSDF